MTTAVIASYALLSLLIIAFHLSAWVAAGAGDGGLGDPGGFFARIGWGFTTYLLGLAWMALLLFASWRVLRSAVDFLDVFLQPGGVTPGGNGTLQHILISAGAGGIAAVQLAHALARRRGVRS